MIYFELLIQILSIFLYVIFYNLVTFCETTTAAVATTATIDGGETSGGFQFKVGRTCRDFNVQNAYAKLFAPLVARSLVFSAGPPTMDKVHADVATTKISKSDQWRQVERDAGASRTPPVVSKPARTNVPASTLKFGAPKDKLLFRGGRPALKPLQSALRSL